MAFQQKSDFNLPLPYRDAQHCNINFIDKALVLKALYNYAQPPFCKPLLSYKEAQRFLNNPQLTKLKGKTLCINLRTNTFDTTKYNKHTGSWLAQKVVALLRQKIGQK